jgi:hypothetical protein
MRLLEPMQGIKMIGGHPTFHIAAFVAMTWITM